MSKFTPWSQEQAEDLAREYSSKELSSYESVNQHDKIQRAVLWGLAKAAEMIEACETVFVTPKYTDVDHDPSWHHTHQAKLVGVRPIEEKKK
jgi:hypothetical protein